ncbi:TlpA family protein disulfide reductase [Mycolicibacterium hodleri]|uniref:Thioredoxin family protein n=1 Tax=Mycolicibacterium hodleri TaxID=49897 RepID=A0A502E352_9MYCO|nr:thioredoxin family protein [Mycolicibacterium hodleri]TPG32043.1 thioredoxin family protein [Mycolicibacterium hodleri]
MSASLQVVVGVLVAALGVALVVGRILTRRQGVLRHSDGAAVGAAIPELELPPGKPAIVHFSAEWCGPCAGVRRVVDDVCAELPAVAHVEIDMDTHPSAARALSVMSLPTTFVFDGEGRQRYRTSGVPKAVDLRSAVEPLLA